MNDTQPCWNLKLKTLNRSMDVDDQTVNYTLETRIHYITWTGRRTTTKNTACATTELNASTKIQQWSYVNNHLWAETRYKEKRKPINMSPPNANLSRGVPSSNEGHEEAHTKEHWRSSPSKPSGWCPTRNSLAQYNCARLLKNNALQLPDHRENNEEPRQKSL